MSILSDHEIKRLVREHGMIDPFIDHQVRDGCISYGLSSYGYDIRCSQEFKLFTLGLGVTIDPKNFDSRAFIDLECDSLIIPANSFALARSVEYFKIPRNITAVCVGKSTYARCGIVVNTTPLEAGWEGILTLEISNTAPLPAKVYSGEGICQVLFFQAHWECETSYADRAGKYQHQKEIVTAKL